jgi:hypothetical protein
VITGGVYPPHNRLLLFSLPRKGPAEFGFEQDFDEKTNEHNTLIEYRVRVKGTMQSAPSKQQVN